MSMYTSDINRVTGLSGIDTESMIDKMMKAESAKYEKMEKEKTKLTWEQESFRTIMTSMKNFQDKWFGTNKSNNISYDVFWNNYITSVTDSTTGQTSNAIKINSTTNSGNYEIEVTQKAEMETITGGKIENSITADVSKLQDSINNYGEVSFKFNLDGVTKDINITSQDLQNGKQLKDVLNEKFKDAFGDKRITAELSTDGKQLTFKPVGDGHSLSISDGAEMKTASTTLSGVLGPNTNQFSLEINEYKVSIAFASGDSEDDKLKKIQDSLKNATKSDGTTSDLTSYVSLSKGENGDLVVKNKSSSNTVTIKTSINGQSEKEKTLNPTSSLGASGIEKTTNSITLNTKLTDISEELFTSGDEAKLNFGGKDITINKNDTIQTFINKVNSSDANVTLSFNEVTTRFEIKSKQSGANGNVKIDNTDTQDFLKKLKLDVTDKKDTSGINSKYIQGQDAIFKIDGIETTRPSNEISMNGINFTINGTGKVNIEAKTDVDTTMKKIKEFVEDYNKLIDDIQKQVSTSRPKSDNYSYYEPLSDEEKDAMNEDDIKKWEEKAKTGLLYNDENLQRLLGDLRDNIYKSVDIGGKSISLYEIGITTTSNYKDGGKLQIDEDKLRTALEERGDEVRQLFTKSKDGIAEAIKGNLNDAIGSKGYLREKAGMEGTASVSNNQLSDEIKDMTERIAQERERLYNKEMQYFEMFSAMEAAMNQQNSQMSALLSFTGQ